mgnify:FL=1
MGSNWGSMMGDSWGFGFWAWAMVTTWLIWLVVGVMLIIWLWRRIDKK